MAGAQSAASRGTSSIFYNPARLSEEKQPVLNVDLRMSIPTARILLDTPLDPDDPLAPRLPERHAGLGLGLVLPFTGLLEDWATLGVSVYLPAERVMMVRGLDPAQPFVYLYDSSPAHIEVLPALAIKWWRYLATGIGLRSGGGLEGPLRFGADFISGTSSHQEVDTQLVYRFSPMAGLQVGPFQGDWGRLEFGFDYREALATGVDLDSQIPLGGVNAEFALSIDLLANFTPRTLVVGAAYAFRDFVVGAADLQYAFWSEAPDPAPDVFLDVRGDDLEALGLQEGLDVPQPGRSRNGPPGFSDTLTTRVGGESTLLDGALIMRVGYAHRPTPIPQQVSGTNFADSNSHQIGLGLGSRFRLPWDLLENDVRADLAWQTHLFMPRAAIKESPDDPVGTWHLQGAVHNVMLGMRYGF
jgi:hypothetical protein